MKNYKFNLVVMLAFTGIFFLGCDTTDDADEPVATEYSADISGTDDYQNISGEGSAISTDTEFTADVSISGSEPGSSHPWHVHEGTCDTGGGIYGPAGSYTILEVDGDGSAETTATIIDSGLNADDDYHINVHLSSDEMGTIVACGDLEED